MQPTPLRLSQAIWSAFRAAKPVHTRTHPYLQCHQDSQLIRKYHPQWQRSSVIRSRFYSDVKSPQNIEEQVQSARDRIHDSLESRAEQVADSEPSLKNAQDETIIHTLPESASIVYTKDSATTPDVRSTQSESTHTNAQSGSDMPSQIAALRSKASKRFSHFMDNLQSQIFIASRRINDLTGYTGIERLKREIEMQESLVQDTRKLVKTNRAKYSDAIATRSATQREVNDLLHRKHTWSPRDLERFTSLYSVDHANEQAEHRAQQELGDAEAQYEEASTKLARSILARYHEEQIWSDKIRQMSTWGTWGLMGLNILLFIVLQLAIEPWRRRRLVRGFEDKVAQALAANPAAALAAGEMIQSADRPADQVVAEAVKNQPDGAVTMASTQVAEAIVDAVTGATSEKLETSNISDAANIESAAEQVISEELAKEAQVSEALIQTAETISGGGSSEKTPLPGSATAAEPDQKPTPNSSKPFAGTSAWSHMPASLYASLSMTYSYYWQILLEQFNDKHHVVLSQRELTTRILEAVVTGAAITGGMLFVLTTSRGR